MEATRPAADGAGREPSGSVGLLGTVSLRGPDGSVVGVTRPQVQVVLAYLVLERRPVGRDELAEVLWGDRPLANHWQGAVRGVVSKVRDLVASVGLDAAVASLGDGTFRLDIGTG